MNMNRRQLLKNAGFLTSSVVVFGLVGCKRSVVSPSLVNACLLPQG